LLDGKILGEFTESSFYKLKKSNLKQERTIVENLYSDIKDTLFIFSADNESYSFLYVTHLEKIIPMYFLINYENRYEDQIGFYDQFQEQIDTFDVNECNVTIVSSESGMIRLIISKENDKMRRLEFETDIEIGNTADDHLEEQSTTKSEEENVWDTAIETEDSRSDTIGDLGRVNAISNNQQLTHR
jgi:hypothetical protein